MKYQGWGRKGESSKSFFSFFSLYFLVCCCSVVVLPPPSACYSRLVLLLLRHHFIISLSLYHQRKQQQRVESIEGFLFSLRTARVVRSARNWIRKLLFSKLDMLWIWYFSDYFLFTKSRHQQERGEKKFCNNFAIHCVMPSLPPSLFAVFLWVLQILQSSDCAIEPSFLCRYARRWREREIDDVRWRIRFTLRKFGEEEVPTFLRFCQNAGRAE